MGLVALLAGLALIATACPTDTPPADGDGGPAPAEGGSNWMGWANEEATELMKQADQELDPEARAELHRQIEELARQDIASIPLYAKPTYLVWNSARLGPDLDFNAAQGGFSIEMITNWELTGNDTLVFGAEQWPECLNPITACYQASWLHWTILLPTMAQFIRLDPENNYIASPLITEMPSLENGGLTEDPFTVTFNLTEAAVWDDGNPITAEDVEFTWQAFMNTPDAYTTTGWEKIKSVSGEDRSVTIEFTEPYAPWRDLFGASNYILKAAAFDGENNLTGQMADSLPFSGGPFMLESFTTSEAVLVRNPGWAGPAPNISRIVYRSISETTSEVAAFRTGEIDAFFPQANDALREIFDGRIANAEIKVKSGTQYEGLWFNLDMWPVNDPAVREALLLGLNRQAALDAVVTPLFPEAALNHCLMSVPGVAEGVYCPENFPIEQDIEAAQQALRDGGWEPVEEEGVITGWEKDGIPLEITLATTAGNAGREQFQAILQQSAADELGIQITTDNSLAGFLFQSRAPRRDFTWMMFAFVASPDPTVTSNWGADQIPPCNTCPGVPEAG